MSIHIADFRLRLITFYAIQIEIINFFCEGFMASIKTLWMCLWFKFDENDKSSQFFPICRIFFLNLEFEFIWLHVD